MCIGRIVCVGCLPWQVSHLLTNLNLRFLPTQTPRRPSDDSPSRCVFKLTLPPSQSLFCGYRGVTDLFHRTNARTFSRFRIDLLFDQISRGAIVISFLFPFFFFFETLRFSNPFFQDCNIEIFERIGEIEMHS